MIPYGRQSINDDDIHAVVEVLKSDFLTQGNCVTEFEQALCRYTGARYGTVVNSATSALHLACLGLGVNHNSLVWTSPISFVASANCARYCGAQVDFVDIDYRTHNMDAAKLAHKLAQANATQQPLPDVVIVVHMAGLSCDMEAIHSLSKTYGFKIIEDASHAIGGRYQHNAIGCGDFSDACIFSFHPVKIITTGEGGALMCNDAALHEKVQRLRSHGITRDPALMGEQAPWYYQQLELGFNYRMTDVQCALGMSQLQRIDQFIERRRQLARQYYEALKDTNLILPNVDGSEYSAWHLYIVKMGDFGPSRRLVYDSLIQAGVGVNVHYIPIYKQPDYQALGFNERYCDTAEWYYQQCLTLPLHPALSDDEFNQVVTTLRSLL